MKRITILWICPLTNVTPDFAMCGQGIIDMNRNGNSPNFFSDVRNDKKSKELFASFLNRITYECYTCVF